MNSDIEKYIKGESKNSYSYFGAHKVNDGVCFRLYAPHAKDVEVVVNQKNHKMNKIDFRGIFEVRISDLKEFDSYNYEILTSSNSWINKNDPFTFYSEDNKSMYIDTDEYVFEDENWINKVNDDERFNACVLNDEFKIDEQRDLVTYLRENSFNYVIIRPYNNKYLFCVNENFINESSLKNFINNLHQYNIGVIFDFDTENFYDYAEGLNDFDGESIYNLKEEKYKDVNSVYFDFNRNQTKSYVKSFVNYYMDKFHGDGLYLNYSEFNKELVKDYEKKKIIFRGKENNSGFASSIYVDQLIDNINNGFDYKKFINIAYEEKTYFVIDYVDCINKIKGNEEYKNEIIKILLALVYVSSNYKISTYTKNREYNTCLKYLANLYTESRALHGKNKFNFLLNGKKNKYFVYEYVSKNDYVMLVINFGELEDDKFDIGMNFYGYYKLILDTKTNEGSEDLLFTRNKKIHNKDIALKINLKSNHALIFRRIRDI